MTVDDLTPDQRVRYYEAREEILTRLDDTDTALARIFDSEGAGSGARFDVWRAKRRAFLRLIDRYLLPSVRS